MVENIQIQPSVDMSGLEKFVREKILPQAAERDRKGEFALDLYRELHKMGWFQAFVPAELGGLGMGLPDLIHLGRRLAYASSAFAGTLTASMLGMGPPLLYGSDEMKRDMAREALDALTLWGFAMTEPDTGTDLVNTKTTASPVEGGYRLNGKKCFITNGNYARHFTVFAKVVDAEFPEKKATVTAFHVPADAAGFTRGEPLKKLGQREANATELYFDEVFVPESQRIGKVGDGLRIASHCLQRSKTLISSFGVGMCDRASEIVYRHLAQRLLYGGKPLLTLPTIQNQLAELHTEAEAAWLLVCQAASAWEGGNSPGFAVREASMAKVYAANVAAKTMGEMLELFGGYGFCAEFEIERLYRDVKILEIFEGATLVQNGLIAKEIFREYLPKADAKVIPLKKAA